MFFLEGSCELDPTKHFALDQIWDNLSFTLVKHVDIPQMFSVVLGIYKALEVFKREKKKRKREKKRRKKKPCLSFKS